MKFRRAVEVADLFISKVEGPVNLYKLSANVEQVSLVTARSCGWLLEHEFLATD